MQPDQIVARTSLYANDVGLFIKLTIPNVRNMQQILLHFGKVSDLNMNMTKSIVFTIQTYQQLLHSMPQHFQGSVRSFLTNYLAMPLHFGRVTRVDEQLVADKITHRLAR